MFSTSSLVARGVRAHAHRSAPHTLLRAQTGVSIARPLTTLRPQQRPIITHHIRSIASKPSSTGTLSITDAMASTNGGDKQRHIVVLGAGVIGLQTALHLTTLSPSPLITIIAADLPTTPLSLANINFTSPRAGAHWRSQGAHDAALDTPTYTHWRSLLSHVTPEHGIATLGLATIDSEYLWNKHTNETADAKGRGIWWKQLVDDFCVIPSWELPKDAAFGVRFKAFGINPVKYMEYLLREVQQKALERSGKEVKILQRKVEGLHDAVETVEKETGEGVDVIVNCTGMGARWLKGVEDEEVFPVKGQTVLVKGECRRNRFVDTGKGWVDTVIRRPGVGTILGVSKVEDDWSENIEDDLTERILTRCKSLAPELLNANGEFDVIDVCIGRRPTRPSGVRIETETISMNGKERIICHHYGHSGGGFQNSIGSADKALAVLDKAFTKQAQREAARSNGTSKL